MGDVVYGNIVQMQFINAGMEAQKILFISTSFTL